MTQQLRLIQISEVQSKIGKKKAWIYERIKSGEFPAQVKVGPRHVAWVESEIDAWINARIADRDSRATAS